MNLESLVLPIDIADKGFKIGIGAAVAGVTALVGAMSLAVKATFTWAAELDSIQDIIGGTNTEAAALNFTLRKSGTSTETFNKSMTILSKGLVKADGSLDTTGKSLAAWGINVKDANGNLKSQSQLIAEASQKYNEFGTQQERVNFLTETFGRGGAEMVDFFDTLAQEGGIDAVTSKVERLGLVIDPARYENFTRALEELKLVGLGLAVGFTEKVMPAFEKFLEIVTGPGTLSEKANTLLASIDDFVGNVIEGFATSIDNWVAGGGPEELSAKLISWIENIGEGDQSKILTAAEHLVTAIATALIAVDWGKIGMAIDTKLAETFDGMDWAGAGTSFGNGIDSLLSGEFNKSLEDFKLTMPSSISSLLQGIDEFLLSATGASAFGGWDMFFGVWKNLIAVGFAATIENWKIEMNNLVFRAKELTGIFIGGLITSWASGIQQWGTTILNLVIGYVNKIITAFNSIPLVPDMGLLSNVTSPGAGLANRAGRGGRRASGGAVIGGQSYNVAEFFKPEQFTPAVNGRVDPIGGGDDLMSTLGFMMQDFADKIARSNQSMVEKVGR